MNRTFSHTPLKGGQSAGVSYRVEFKVETISNTGTPNTSQSAYNSVLGPICGIRTAPIVDIEGNQTTPATPTSNPVNPATQPISTPTLNPLAPSNPPTTQPEDTEESSPINPLNALLPLIPLAIGTTLIPSSLNRIRNAKNQPNTPNKITTDTPDLGLSCRFHKDTVSHSKLDAQYAFLQAMEANQTRMLGEISSKLGEQLPNGRYQFISQEVLQYVQSRSNSEHSHLCNRDA